MPPTEEEIRAAFTYPDPWLYLGSAKLHLANHQPMTDGDEAAWEILDRLREEARWL